MSNYSSTENGLQKKVPQSNSNRLEFKYLVFLILYIFTVLVSGFFYGYPPFKNTWYPLIGFLIYGLVLMSFALFQFYQYKKLQKSVPKALTLFLFDCIFLLSYAISDLFLSYTFLPLFNTYMPSSNTIILSIGSIYISWYMMGRILAILFALVIVLIRAIFVLRNQYSTILIFPFLAFIPNKYQNSLKS